MNLHDAIMNIPIDIPDQCHETMERETAYRVGHRDARHAAAELAAPLVAGVLRELLDVGQFAVESTDDVAIMLRLGQATDNARALLAKLDGDTK